MNLDQRRDEITKWFGNSNVSASGMIKITHDFLESSHPMAIYIHHCIGRYCKTSDIINFPDLSFLFASSWDKPMPFKFGKLHNIFMTDADLNQIKTVVNDELILAHFSVALVNVQEINLFDIVNTASLSKNIDTLEFDIFNLEEEKAITDATLAIHHLTVTDNIRNTRFVIRGIHTNLVLNVTQKFGDSLRINVLKAHRTNPSLNSTGTLQFSTVMDLQEWLVDNGYENLA